MLNRKLKSSCFAIMVIASVGIARADTTLRRQLTPFFERYCFDCHSGDTPQAGLNLKTYSVDLTDAGVRRRSVHLFDRVANGEMPPKSADRPDAESKSKFLQLLCDSLTQAQNS